MDDLIYRNALIEELKKIKFPCMLPSGAEYLEGVQTAVTRISGVIDDAPAVNRWIPCSKKLPEIDKDVLVYAVRKDGVGDDVTTITRYVNYIWFGHRIDCEPHWQDPWQYFHSDYEITHWMPKPGAPAKEEKP